MVRGASKAVPDGPQSRGYSVYCNIRSPVQFVGRVADNVSLLSCLSLLEQAQSVNGLDVMRPADDELAVRMCCRTFAEHSAQLSLAVQSQWSYLPDRANHLPRRAQGHSGRSCAVGA